VSVTLWPHQSAAADAVDRDLERFRSTLLVHATGTGKTTTFAECIRRRRPIGRALVIADRKELIRQAFKRIPLQTGLSVSVEMNKERASLDSDVVVATVQTLSKLRRRERFPADHFGTIVVDEADLAVAQGYRLVLDHFPGAKVLGVTATADRSDGAALGLVFDSVAHVYDIRDGIRDGFLCPIRQRSIKIDGLDFSKCRTTAGDLNDGDLQDALVEFLPEIAAAIIREGGDRRAIVFTPTVPIAYQLAAELNKIDPGGARACDGTTHDDERDKTVEDFDAGAFPRLVNCALWVRGFDSPGIELVAVVRPTKSRSFYSQMAGRGTRIFPGKRDCLLLDFRGNAGRHKLVGPLDVLGGTDAVKERAETKCAADPDLDMLRALVDAEVELDAERRADILKRARYQSADVDPFDLADAMFTDARATPSTAGFEENLRYLATRAPGAKADKMKPSAVAALVGTLQAREAAGRASWAQMRCLARAGVHVDLSAREAALAIAILHRDGWRALPGLRRALEGVEVEQQLRSEYQPRSEQR